MKPGILLFVLRDVVNSLETSGTLAHDGTLSVNFGDASADVGLAWIVETSLKAHGVTVPAQIDKVLAALPLFVSVLQ